MLFRSHIIGNVITIYLGTTPEEYMGYRWTEADLPLIEAHEFAHLELMKEDNSEAKFRGFEDCGRETQIAAIREEVAPWKIAVKDKVLMPETLAKIHTMLNTYVFSHLRKEEMYK